MGRRQIQLSQALRELRCGMAPKLGEEEGSAGGPLRWGGGTGWRRGLFHGHIIAEENHSMIE